jgi:hypothetical protein
MYYNTLEKIRQEFVGADERAGMPQCVANRVTVEDMIWLNELIEGRSSNGRNQNHSAS